MLRKHVNDVARGCDWSDGSRSGRRPNRARPERGPSIAHRRSRQHAQCLISARHITKTSPTPNACCRAVAQSALSPGPRASSRVTAVTCSSRAARSRARPGTPEASSRRECDFSSPRRNLIISTFRHRGGCTEMSVQKRRTIELSEGGRNARGCKAVGSPPPTQHGYHQARTRKTTSTAPALGNLVDFRTQAACMRADKKRK